MLRLLITGKYRVVGVLPSVILGGGNIGILEGSRYGLVGVLILRPPHR